jgi:hypothetical protein
MEKMDQPFIYRRPGKGTLPHLRSWLKAGRLRKRVSNPQGSIFRPFPYLKTIEIFLSTFFYK